MSRKKMSSVTRNNQEKTPWSRLLFILALQFSLTEARHLSQINATAPQQATCNAQCMPLEESRQLCATLNQTQISSVRNTLIVNCRQEVMLYNTAQCCQLRNQLNASAWTILMACAWYVQHSSK